LYLQSDTTTVVVTSDDALCDHPAMLRMLRLGVPFLIVCLLPSRPAAGSAAQPVLDRLTIMAPAAPGGGWDQTARAMQHALEAQGLVRVVQVENVPGAAGTIGLSQFMTGKRGRGDALLVTGLVMLAAILWNEAPVSLAQVTPIARLTGEYEVIAVPASGPHREIRSLVDALRANPWTVSWGGGSAGGTDHILAGLIVAAAGVDARRANYIAFSGGGEAVASLLGGNVTAGISGYSEFAAQIQSGRLRAIGIATRERVPGIDVPTLREQGLDVDLVNWRAVMAPPGISADQRRALVELMTQLVRSSSWQKTLADLKWTDLFLAGDPFATFLETERVRVAPIIGPLRHVSAGPSAQNVGEWVFPSLVGFAGVIVAWLFVNEARQRRNQSARAQGQGSRDQDLSRARGQVVHARRRALLWTAAGPLLFLATLNLAGFIIASTFLFMCVATAFGSRLLFRDAAVALVLSAVLYVAFTRGLGLALPAGSLKTVFSFL
jgi:putative tricarboxylic transport membrane protein